jgi:hypothetical protein
MGLKIYKLGDSMQRFIRPLLFTSVTIFCFGSFLAACGPSHKAHPNRYAPIAAGTRSRVNPLGQVGATGVTGMTGPTGVAAASGPQSQAQSAGQMHPPTNEADLQLPKTDIAAVEELKTELCRITDSPMLNKEQAAQSQCEALIVKTDDSGKIIFDQKHSLKNYAAHVFSQSEFTTNNAGKVTAEYTSQKKMIANAKGFESKTTSTNDENILFLAYQLPIGTQTSISKDSIVVKLKFDGQEEKMIESSQIETISGTDTSSLVIRIKDANLFTNINFKISVEYSLNPNSERTE